MLGRFLELSMVTPDTGGDWQLYQKLGFEPASTGDIWSHAYGVVACEALAIGLHGAGDEPLSITFVRPQVASLQRELLAGRVDVERAQLGSDVFNELTLREPGGVALRVLEARSFSPPLQIPQRTAVGRFTAISLPSRDVETTLQFWRTLRYECLPLEEPWEGYGIAGLPLAVHTRRLLAEPALVFRGPVDVEALTRLGLQHEPPLPLLRDVPHLQFRLPAGMPAVVLSHM
jgi:hypothetical protein